jgi:hypothetical protein
MLISERVWSVRATTSQIALSDLRTDRRRTAERARIQFADLVAGFGEVRLTCLLWLLAGENADGPIRPLARSSLFTPPGATRKPRKPMISCSRKPIGFLLEESIFKKFMIDFPKNPQSRL